ncbi:hypothetical protein LI187_11035 [bacterium 210820-DFI.6.38]|nr:hypothetical protein [bacterium 210820-DFI.6.38]
MAVNYGQVAIVPKGVWNAETQYKVNNLVEYDGSSYVAKVQPPVGTLPTDTSYWQVSAAGTKKATADSLGTVMPDGTTTEIKEDGKLSAKTAQQNALGVVKGSDDVTVGEDGNLTVNTTFEQATEIANIIAGEAIKSVLGKVSKAIATTMSLDENALLKNMISGIDVNDGNKVPSSAYIHSLVERIGMGTAIEGGFDNLTAGLNSVNNNLSNNLYKAAYTDDIFITTERPTFVYWNGNTKNTPYKSGLTSCTEGFAFSYGAWAGYMTVVCFVKNDSTMWIWSKSRNAWVEYAAKSDLEPVKSRQINTYTSANKDTDATLSSYESKTENFILLFTSNDTTGTIPTLTGSHLFAIEHLLVGDDSASAIERAYSTKGKLIAWRFKQWWNKTWTAWENS